MTELRKKQSRFVRSVADLIIFTYDHGYELTFGETYRTPEQSRWNADHGLGIQHSLHGDRLAIDFNLFRDDFNLTSIEAFTPLGEFWEQLAVDNAWGGRFVTRPDPFHFSIAHGGRR